MSERKWGHLTLPDNAVMRDRYDVQVGDTVLSSHYGEVVVTQVLRGKERSHVVQLNFAGGSEQYPRLERYDGDSQMPVLVDTTTTTKVEYVQEEQSRYDGRWMVGSAAYDEDGLPVLKQRTARLAEKDPETSYRIVKVTTVETREVVG